MEKEHMGAVEHEQDTPDEQQQDAKPQADGDPRPVHESVDALKVRGLHD